MMAKVQRCVGGGVWLSLADGTRGTVALTDLHDSFVANALERLKPDMIVRARVTQVNLSPVQCAATSDTAAAAAGGSAGGSKDKGRQGSGGVKGAVRGLTLRPSEGCMHAGAILLVPGSWLLAPWWFSYSRNRLKRGMLPEVLKRRPDIELYRMRSIDVQVKRSCMIADCVLGGLPFYLTFRLQKNFVSHCIVSNIIEY